MIVLPVIARELRAESRHPLTYWLRVLGAVALLTAAASFWLDRGFRERQGTELFSVLHHTLFWAIWILVPLITADCISRERREGTLGLLFLTPLRARDIVIAKVLAHGLRAMTACLAALPVVVLPFLMGGVDWRIASASVLVNLISFCWALGAGLLASARNKSMTSALVWSALWAFLFFWIMIWLAGVFFLHGAFARPGGRMFAGSTIGYLASGLASVFSFQDMWQWWLARVGPPGSAEWLQLYAWVLSVSFFALIGLVLLAAFQVRRRWQDQPPSIQRLKIEKRLFTPAYALGFFRRWMRSMLERNPIGWLERRTWSGRLVSWSWLAVLIALYSFALDDFGRGMGMRLVNDVVPFLLIGSVALSAAGSFRRERELGVMELLLVTPLRVGQIVSGRLRGLWAQFLPAMMLLMGLWLYLVSGRGLGSQWNETVSNGLYALWCVGISFLTLPILGLYFSLRCRHYIVSLFLTLVGGVLVPAALAMISHRLFHSFLEAVGDSVLVLYLVPAGALVVIAARGFAGLPDYRDIIGRGGLFLGFLLAYFGMAAATSADLSLKEMLQGCEGFTTFALAFAQIATAIPAGFKLHRDLSCRTFAFQA